MRSWMKVLVVFGVLACNLPIVGSAQTDSLAATSVDTALAKRLLAEAKELIGKEENDEAEGRLNRAGAVFEKVLGKESLEYADVLHQMGRVWIGRKDYDQGILFTQQALDIRLEVLGEQNLVVATSYNNLGISYEKNGDFNKSIKNYEKALGIRIKLLGNDHLDIAQSYNVLGISYASIGQYNKSIEYFEKALILRQKIFGEEHPTVASSYNNLGLSYGSKGEYDKSVGYYEKALNLRLKLFGEEHHAVSASYNNLGVSYASNGEFGKAIGYFEKAVSVHLKLSNEEDSYIADSYNNLGGCYDSRGEYDKAIAYYDKAFRIRLELFGIEHLDMAASYNNLGGVYDSKGDYDKAIEYKQYALKLRLKLLGNEHPDVAASYNNLGVSFYSKGEYDKAIGYHDKALSLRLKLLENGHPDVASSYNNLGVSFYSKGEYNKAIRYYEKALDFRLKLFGEGHPDVAKSYNNLGASYGNKGEYTKEIWHYEKSLSIRLKLLGEGHPDVATSYNNLGASHGNMGEYAKEVGYYKQALNLYLKLFGEENPDVAHSHNNLGNYHASRGEYDEAITSYLNALRSVNYNSLRINQVNSLKELLRALSPLSQTLQQKYLKSLNHTFLEKCQKYLNEALLALDYQSSTFTSESSRTYWQFQNHPIYAQAIDISLLAADVDHNDTLRRQTFTYAEKSKATQLQAQLKNADALAYSGIPDSLTQQEHQLRVDLTWREKQRQGLLDQGKAETDSTVLRLSSILFDLRQQYDTLKIRFEKNYPEYFRLKYDLRTVPLQYVQDSLLQPGQSLLEYFVGDSSIYLFLVQPKNYEVIKIKKDTAFDQWVEDLTRNGIYGFYGKKGVSKGKSINNFGTAAYHLYETLIAPVKAKLPKDEKLIIIPDGILGYVPFEALLTEKPPRPDAIPAYKYLIQDHQISYCYSATLLKEMRNKKHRQEPTQKLLAMAPFFLGNADTLLSQVDSTEFIAGISLRDTLTALPNSGEEVARIHKILKGQAFYGKAATLAQFQKLAAQARILHLSTHGKADDRLGDYAYLAFGMPNVDGTFDKLYARDLYNLSLNADLVVLSACETGTGKLQRGEGIVSLARAFAYAGAKSIVTTLWKVSDEQSKNLMSSFYKYLSKGKDKDEALRLAKLDFLKANEKRTELLHPFFWASFIGIGDMGGLENIK